MSLARTLPPTLIFQRFLSGLSTIYHALQQWEEARSTLEEAESVAERLDLGRLRRGHPVATVHETAPWQAVGQAHTYALQAMTVARVE